MLRLIAIFVLLGISQVRADEVVLYSAGSPKDALTAVAADYTAKTGVTVKTSFGPSGLMREKRVRQAIMSTCLRPLIWRTR
jgi:molybdate transport system substrate-binding protein